MNRDILTFVGLLLLAIVLGGLIIVAGAQVSNDCHNKGGVYIYRINQCMKKDFFIQ